MFSQDSKFFFGLRNLLFRDELLDFNTAVGEKCSSRLSWRLQKSIVLLRLATCKYIKEIESDA